MTHNITNSLPSAPPIFLRGGKLILVNAPATRVSQLKNRYTLIAALDNLSAKGTFLAAKDFTNNHLIDACVQNGCAIEFEMVWRSNKSVTLEWMYKGKAANM
jgi:hypothetical protein